MLLKHSTRYPTALILTMILSAYFGQTRLVVGEETGVTAQEPEELLVYDASTGGLPVARHDALSGDFAPQVAIAESGGKKWLQISFIGSSGQARSKFALADIVKQLVAEGKIIQGVAVTIDYEQEDAGRIALLAHSPTGVMTLNLGLEKGEHVYRFVRGHRRNSPDWNQLQGLDIRVQCDGKNPRLFRIGKITILAENASQTAKTHAIEFVRPVKEILFAASPVSGNGTEFLTAYDWDQLPVLDQFPKMNTSSPFPGNPVGVRIGYDDTHLFLRAQSAFPSAPEAKVTEKDMAVWQDESLEVFFGGECNNNQHIQFVINAKGAVYDSVREYDEVAANVINTHVKDVPHIARSNFANGIMTHELAFPLAALKVDPKLKPFADCQLVQNYNNREKMAALRWSNGPYEHRNASLEASGLLVLNRAAFGSGRVMAEEIISTPTRDPMRFDLRVTVNLAGFEPGQYEATQWLTAPDKSVSTREETLEIQEDRKISFLFPNAKCLNGVFERNRRGYVWTLALRNSKGDSRVASVTFSNETEIISRFGETLVWPRPKSMTLAEGAFLAGMHGVLSLPRGATERTRRTAELFREKLMGFSGRNYALEEGADKDIVLRIAASASHRGKNETLKPNGYHLKVTPDRVEITGADEPGLFYGTVSFIQLLKSPMNRRNDAPVPCAEILDWPDLPNRIASMCYSPDVMKTIKVKEKFSREFLLDWIDRFVAGNKFSIFMPQIGTETIFKRCPEVNFRQEDRALTLEDWKAIAAFCRERFIEISPQLLSSGHNYWLIQARPEFEDKGWHSSINFAHPDFWPTYRDCALDIIEATNCKTFNPVIDEVWHQGKPGVVPEELVFGKTRAQAFMDFYNQLNDFFKTHGVKMVAYENMLSPYNNGKRYDVYKHLDRFPRDVIIAPWSNSTLPTNTKLFQGLGFTEFWTLQTGFGPISPEYKKYYSGFGTNLFGVWGGGNAPSGGEQCLFQWMAHWFRGSDYAWNFHIDAGQSEEDEINSGTFPALSAQFAETPNPYADETVLPLDISASLNVSLSAFMKARWPSEYATSDVAVELGQGPSDIGNIPMILGDPSRNCVIAAPGETPSFPATGKFSSLIFLHAAIDPLDMKAELRGKDGNRMWHRGMPLGHYRITYHDGTVETARIRMGQETGWLKTRLLGASSLFNRYILIGKDANVSNVFLYQYEWVNPHPDKDISGVEFVSEPEIALPFAICAVSGRNIQPAR